MKTRFLIFAALFLTGLFAGCIEKKSFNVSMKIMPVNEFTIASSGDMDDAASIIRKRLINFGIPDEKIRMETSTRQISLSLAGIDTAGIDVIREIITVPGNLEFWETFENSELIEYLVRVNQDLKSNNPGIDLKPWEPAKPDTLSDELQALVQDDTAGTAAKEAFGKQNPLFGILIPQTNYDGTPRPSCLIGLCNLHDTSKVNSLFRLPSIRNLFPRNLKLMWSAKPYQYDESNLYFELHAIKNSTISKQPILSGRDITSAEVVETKSADVLIRFLMTGKGAETWRRMTAYNIDRCIAITIDGGVRTYPRVMNEIAGGKTEITGNFSLAEAQGLAVIFNSEGLVLPLRLKISDLNVQAK